MTKCVFILLIFGICELSVKSHLLIILFEILIYFLLSKLKSQQSFSLGFNLTTLSQITYNEALSLTKSIKEKVILSEALIKASLPANFTAQINTSAISTPIPIDQPTTITSDTTTTTTTTLTLTVAKTTLTSSFGS